MTRPDTVFLDNAPPDPDFLDPAFLDDAGLDNKRLAHTRPEPPRRADLPADPAHFEPSEEKRIRASSAGSEPDDIQTESLEGAPDDETNRDAPSEAFAGLSRKLDELESRLREHRLNPVDKQILGNGILRPDAVTHHGIGPSTPRENEAQSDKGRLAAPACPIILRAIENGRDHDDFGSIRSKVMDVIDSKNLERKTGGKPGSTFPHPALMNESAIPLESAMRDLTARMADTRISPSNHGAQDHLGRRAPEVPFTAPRSGTPAARPSRHTPTGTDAADLIPPAVDKRPGARSSADTPVSSDGLDHASGPSAEKLASPRSPRPGITHGAATEVTPSRLPPSPHAHESRLVEERPDAGSTKDEAIGRIYEPPLADLLSRHFESISRQLSARLDAGLAETLKLEELVVQWTNRMDALHGSDLTDGAIEALKGDIGRVADRLDRTDQGIASLTSLERTIEGLLEGLADMHAPPRATARTTPQEAHSIAAPEPKPSSDARTSISFENEPSLAREIAELRALQEEAGRRTDASTTAILDLLKKISNRLGTLEADQTAPQPDRDDPLRATFTKETKARSSIRSTAPDQANCLFDDRRSDPGTSPARLTDVLIEPGGGFPRSAEKTLPRSRQSKTPPSELDAKPRTPDFHAEPPRPPASAETEAPAKSRALAHFERKQPQASRKSAFHGARKLVRTHQRSLLFTLAILLISIGAYAFAKIAHPPSSRRAPNAVDWIGTSRDTDIAVMANLRTIDDPRPTATN